MFGLLQKLLQSNKALVSGAGVALTAVTLTHNLSAIRPANVQGPVGVVLAVLTPILTWLVPNAKPAA